MTTRWLFILISLLLLLENVGSEITMKLRSGRSVMTKMAKGSSPSTSSRGFSGGTMRSDAQTMPHALQRMHNCLKAIPDLPKSVENPLKCPHIVECIERMNEVTLKEVGLEKENLKSRLSYSMSIVSCEEHDIAVFVVPKGNTLPLHDHPGMTVASKLLHGSLEVTSFDHADEHEGLYYTTTEIKKASDDTWILSPSQGNLHQFRALSNCVILDVLTPPYDNTKRKCTFYEVNRIERGGRVLWKLNARPSYWMPDEDSIVYNGDGYYRGLKVEL